MLSEMAMRQRARRLVGASRAGCRPSTTRLGVSSSSGMVVHDGAAHGADSALLVMITGPPAWPAGVERSGQGVEAVGVGRPHDRAVVAVADGEGVGQRVVEGEVLARVVAHGEDAVLRPLPLRRRCGWRRSCPSCPRSSTGAGRPTRGTGRTCTRRRWWPCRGGRAAASGPHRPATPGRRRPARPARASSNPRTPRYEPK